MKALAFIGIAALALEPAGAAEAARTDETVVAFDQLKALVGSWRNAKRPDSPLRIRFSLTAAETVLVESWERDGAVHSLTLYHRDGGQLIATHYCPQGNQPRLSLQPGRPGLRFIFRDATDLHSNEEHLHDLAFDLRDPERLVRSEIYREGDDAKSSSLVLVRE